jgi:hypothetical protein
VWLCVSGARACTKGDDACFSDASLPVSCGKHLHMRGAPAACAVCKLHVCKLGVSYVGVDGFVRSARKQLQGNPTASRRRPAAVVVEAGGLHRDRPKSGAPGALWHGLSHRIRGCRGPLDSDTALSRWRPASGDSRQTSLP